MLTELDVINTALSTMGEAPLNDADEDHPFVSRIKDILAQENEKLQAISWWFNSEKVTLTPDPLSNFIYVPTDAIRCDPLSKLNLDLAVQRGRRLYNTDTNTYEFDEEVECRIVRRIPFDDIPPHAQHAVSAAVSRQFQTMIDGDGQRGRQLEMDYREAFARLRIEHIRNVKSNMINKTSTGHSLWRIGGQIRYTY